MTMVMNDADLAPRLRGEFFQKTLDSLRSHIAVLEEDGTIIAVNSAWNNFASANGLAEQFCGIGANYLRSCDQATGECSEEAAAVATGIRDVVAKRRGYFYREYPCHSSSELRWFSVRITRFEIDAALCVVVTHDNITQRQLAEFKLQEVNRLLELQAVTDGLTGIANRRSFDRMLAQEWKRHERTQSPLSLAMLDVDCFKQYNDQYGHLAGDDCLKAVAQAMQANMRRAGDFVARYGGEEFAVILPNTDMAQAATVLKNALGSVRKLAISHPSSKVVRGIVTMSIGCATVIPSQHDSFSDFLHRADQALYEAKAKGRDQLVFFEPQNRVPVGSCP
jgi:diguanylate cyclase (GGDEF)-like protein